MKIRAPKCILVLSAPEMFGFMLGQPQRLREMGFEPIVISAPSTKLDESAAAEGAGRDKISIKRNISLLYDVIAFIQLSWIFFNSRPAAVILSGPKAIFLGGLAAWLVGVNRRVAVYHGMRQEVMRGPLRWLLDICDRIAFLCADFVLVVSPSLLELVVSRRLCPREKISVTGHGTANGIDAEWYSHTDDISSRAQKLRINLGISDGVPIIGFIGRITEDKGFAALLEVHARVRLIYPAAVLLLIGREEIHTTLGKALLAAAKVDNHVRLTGSVEDVRPYLALMQIFVFPSLREGFPVAPMEAASMGVPTVAFPSTGVIDAVVSGITGTICPAGDVDVMAKAVSNYLNAPEMLNRHGSAGRQRVIDYFRPSEVWKSYSAALRNE